MLTSCCRATGRIFNSTRDLRQLLSLVRISQLCLPLLDRLPHYPQSRTWRGKALKSWMHGKIMSAMSIFELTSNLHTLCLVHNAQSTMCIKLFTRASIGIFSKQRLGAFTSRARRKSQQAHPFRSFSGAPISHKNAKPRSVFACWWSDTTPSC